MPKIVIPEDFVFTLKTFRHYKYHFPQNKKEFMKRVDIINGICRDTEAYQGKHPEAENYATSLFYEYILREKDSRLCDDGFTAKDFLLESIKVFEAIAKHFSGDIIFLNPPDHPCPYPSEEFSPEPGKLGYFGLHTFAKAYITMDQEKKAIPLLEELVNKIPTECNPCQLADIRYDAIKSLLEMGLTNSGAYDLEHEKFLAYNNVP